MELLVGLYVIKTTKIWCGGRPVVWAHEMITVEMMTVDLENAALCDLQGSIRILNSDAVRQVEKFLNITALQMRKQSQRGKVRC